MTNRQQEQADQMISAINRLAAALEQANARPPMAGTIQTVGTPTGQTANVIPMRYYGQPNPKAETPPDEQRPSKQRRPRQSSRS